MEEKLKVTSGLLTLLLLLGVADAALLEGLPSEEEPTGVTTIIHPKKDTPKSDPPKTTQPEKTMEPERKVPTTPTPPGGVRKAQGPDVLEALVRGGFTFQDTKEKMILRDIIPEDTTLETHVLLLDGDRAGAIAWVSSPQVKKFYLVLKEALHSAFTAEVQDLLDETQRREGRPTRNLLTFFDPGLSSERVVFIRVRERLYEFRVAEGASEAIFDLIEDLTK